MRRLLPLGVGAACLLGLFFACFHAVLLRGEQFCFRDAGHFYYPLYLRVQQEWNAGRVPLWSPEENGGMPLLGNPTAAVLYPGKVLYAVMPYAWAARLYTISHVLLAVLGMYALMRSWCVSRTGSGIAAISYAFSGPILFQYCNIIFLVGAAWIPFGIRAADRWLRLGKRSAIVELALVLTMQTLGGEPQSAYLLGLCAGGYAIYLSLARAGIGASEQGRELDDCLTNRVRHRRGVLRVVMIATVVLAGWTATTLLGAWYFPQLRGKGEPIPILPWIPALRIGVVVAWCVIALWMLRRWARRRDWPLGAMVCGLAGSAVLAGCLSAAQLLPVLEYSGLTDRASDEGPHEIYAFSLSPIQCAEWLWPSIYGNPVASSSAWSSAISLGSTPRMWVPTLYAGGPAFVLALAALFARRVPVWHRWLVAIVVVSFLGGLGEYTSPLLYARKVPAVAAWVGASDPREAPAIRLDGKLRDGDGSIYWLMSTVLPGFRSFRYPAKLFTFTTLGLCALAGLGWDGFSRTRRPAVPWVAATVLLFTAALAAGAFVGRAGIERWLSTKGIAKSASLFGPFEVAAAWRGTADALLHGLIVYAAFFAILAATRNRTRLSGVLVLGLLSADVAVANSKYIFSCPQSLFETKPRVLELIDEAERKDPSPGPYRVHRMPHWIPTTWFETKSLDRVREFTVWERATIQPKYALPYHLEYTLTEGTAELFDYQFFFSPFHANVRPAEVEPMNLKPGEKVVYYPRRGFDLWNTRYFVLPYLVANDEKRGIASFLSNVEFVYPPGRSSSKAFTKAERERWGKEQDWQILRNKAVYPRAWVVHQIRYTQPIQSLLRKDRKHLMEEMLYQADRLWYASDRLLLDPKQLAWVEGAVGSLAQFDAGGPPDESETVKFLSNTPQRVELEVTMKRPGLVVLADVNYPGWQLTIDGSPAPIQRTNLVMRGAAVESGKHRLVYTYRPRSFYWGLVLSGVGVLGSIGLCYISRVWSAGLRTTN
jgi:hypothetical protein